MTTTVVVLYTAKVRFFKQITTYCCICSVQGMLFCIPQRYDFSSKSQLATYWGADELVVLYTAKVRFFKQITTPTSLFRMQRSCFVYRKGTIFQANHNHWWIDCCIYLLFCIPQRYDFSSKSQHSATLCHSVRVVLYTAKVRFFKQITTAWDRHVLNFWLFCIPQRYDFSSKSQRTYPFLRLLFGCFVYRKGTIFQANHNSRVCLSSFLLLFCIPQRYDFSSKSQQNPPPIPPREVVLYTAKVRFFKQITTTYSKLKYKRKLFCIPQRYDFSSKSQLTTSLSSAPWSCFVYRKGTIFQANHNNNYYDEYNSSVVLYTAKVRFFKQITTPSWCVRHWH